MWKKVDKYLLLIVLAALGIRFFGIQHGFPFIFHPDEPTIIRSALGVRFDLNPGHFDWPHLYIYANYFVYMVFAKLRDIIVLLGQKEALGLWLPIIWDDKLIFYLITRSFSAILGALTTIPIYLSAKNLFGKKAGYFAAAAIAVTPFHVWHSHYALADVPMAFFLSWAMYFSTFILFRRDVRNYVLAGLFIGLAASTKYNGALGALMVVVAHAYRVLAERDEPILSFAGFESLVYSGIMAIVGFVVGTPYAVFDYKTFIRTDGPKGALWQFTNVGSVSFSEQLNNMYEAFLLDLPGHFGYTLFILFALAFAYLVISVPKDKRILQKRDLLFFVTIGLALIIYVTGLEKTRAHYFFIAYPMVIVASIGGLVGLLSLYQSKYKDLLWVVVLAFPLYFALQGSYTFYQKDTRLILNDWLKVEGQRVSKIYYDDDYIGDVMHQSGLDTDQVKNSFQVFVPNSVFVTVNAERPDLERVETIENAGRRGPKINIYKTN